MLPTAAEREKEFIDSIDKITRRHGKCLIPVFSLGRAQELLLILEEYWANNPELQQIPIYHASRLAAQSLSIYKRFINSMNGRIKAQNDVSNPWDLQHILNLDKPDDFHESGAAVRFFLFCFFEIIQSRLFWLLLECYKTERVENFLNNGAGIREMV